MSIADAIVDSFLFVLGLIGVGLYTLVYWLVTGHIPEHIEFAILGLLAAGIIQGAEGYFKEIRSDGKEIKEQICNLRNEIHEAKMQIGAVDHHIDLLRIELDTVAELAKIRNSRK